MAILRNRNKKDVNRPLGKSDVDFYKMTGVFAIACIFVLLVLRMQGTAMAHQSTGENIAYNMASLMSSAAFRIVACLAFVASAAWFAFCKVKKVNESRRLFTSTNCLAVVLYLLSFVACFGTFRNPSEGLSMYGFFIIFTVICAGLYCISKFGCPDFTMFSLVTAINAVAVYLTAYNFSALSVLIKLLITAAGVGCVILFKKKIDGMKISKKRKGAFLTSPAYVSVSLGFVFMFVRILATPALFMPSYASTQPSVVSQIAGAASALTTEVMLMVFLVEFVAFAMIYTIKLIRD